MPRGRNARPPPRSARGWRSRCAPRQGSPSGARVGLVRRVGESTRGRAVPAWATKPTCLYRHAVPVSSMTSRAHNPRGREPGVRVPSCSAALGCAATRARPSACGRAMARHDRAAPALQECSAVPEAASSTTFVGFTPSGLASTGSALAAPILRVPSPISCRPGFCRCVGRAVSATHSLPLFGPCPQCAPPHARSGRYNSTGARSAYRERRTGPRPSGKTLSTLCRLPV